MSNDIRKAHWIEECFECFAIAELEQPDMPEKPVITAHCGKRMATWLDPTGALQRADLLVADAPSDSPKFTAGNLNFLSLCKRGWNDVPGLGWLCPYCARDKLVLHYLRGRKAVSA
jgi:hypothetical protein